MTELLWHDFLKIGVDFIDNDHRKLLKIMQETKLAIEDGDNKKCVLLLTSLLKEADEYFEREEEYLLKVNYPDLDSHKLYHQELLMKAEATKKICQGIETEHDLKKCFDGMSEFLVDDILRGDINFKSFLEFEGHIKKQ